MKVASWNVNSIRSRLERLQAFLKREQPDVLCLQELKCQDEQFPTKEITEAGYESAIFGQKTYNGVAILSRHPLSDIQRGFEDGDQARFVAASIGANRICSLYVPNGQAVGTEKFQYKLNWLNHLHEFLNTTELAKQASLLMGDFNIAPTDDDCHDPKAWEGKVLFTNEEKAALKKIVSLGFTDTFRQHEPSGKHFSWWDYRMLGFQKNRGMRIDFILASESLSKKCTKAWIDRNERKGQKPSDHAPVLAEFSGV